MPPARRADDRSKSAPPWCEGTLMCVSRVADSLLEQALTLPADERALLASGLLASLDADVSDANDVDRLWSAETERRAAELDAGEVTLATWEQLLQRIDERR